MPNFHVKDEFRHVALGLAVRVGSWAPRRWEGSIIEGWGGTVLAGKVRMESWEGIGEGICMHDAKGIFCLWGGEGHDHVGSHVISG